MENKEIIKKNDKKIIDNFYHPTSNLNTKIDEDNSPTNFSKSKSTFLKREI